MNIVGVHAVAQIQVWLVAVLLALMAGYVAIGLPMVQKEYFDPVLPNGLSAVVVTAGFVFISYGGLLKVSSVAEEVRHPGRAIPLGMLLALVVVGACYTLMVTATTGVLPGTTLDGSLTPISDGAQAMVGRWGAVAMGAAAVLAFVTTANAGILAASRYLLALGRDRLAPPSLGRVNRRFGTPHVAVLWTGSLVIAALYLDLGALVHGASTVLILSFSLSCVCVLVMRESHLQNYRPQFRAPLYPWLQLLGLGGFSLLITAMGMRAYLTSAGLVFLGFLVYWFYGRARADQEYALLHILQRMTARRLVTGRLESELKAIIRERDEIVLDHFDRLVENCPVLDLPGPLARAELFQRVAQALSDRVGIGAEEFEELLVAREQESSTVLAPGLAIPHIVVGGDMPMAMLIARCRLGIRFSEEDADVRAVVVLAGSSKVRNLHLRCLTAIAQVVQSHDFESRWMEAQDEQALRDIFLLADRRRDR